jgi:hypothetical protein
MWIGAVSANLLADSQIHNFWYGSRQECALLGDQTSPLSKDAGWNPSVSANAAKKSIKSTACKGGETYPCFALGFLVSG